MKIAVCDDDLIFQRQIKEELDRYYRSLDVLIEVFSSGEALLEAVCADPYGFFCVFMDIEMPGIDGMETTRRLRLLNRNLPVIFLTSHRDLAMDGYELNAFRFLAKPVEQDRLYRALTDLEAETQDQKRILVTKDGRELFLPIGDILYIKSENIYLSLVTAKESHLIRKKLKEILPLLPSSMFCQIHRSYVVNLQKIISYTGKAVTMEDQAVLPVSRNRREALKEAIIHSMAGRAAWKTKEEGL